MKLTTLILTAAAAAAALAGQDAQHKLVAHIGFPFEVNGRKLPAGNYEGSLPAGMNYLQFRDAATGKAFFVSSAGATASGVRNGALIFAVAADTYVLRTIRTGNAELSVPQARNRREAIAQARTVAVAAGE